MKHPVPVVASLLALFFLANVIGLFVLDRYVDPEATEESGAPAYRELPAGIERPDLEPSLALIYIVAVVLIGTLLLLLLMRFKGAMNLWKVWYFLAAALALSIAWAPFVPNALAMVLGLVASAFKAFRPNFFVHNFTELFIYAGIAAIFAPLLNVAFAAVLLVIASLYDMYAVWKSKHMVRMAEFLTSSNLFAGLALPKSLSMRKGKASKKDMNDSVAILGGGDIALPLLFAGTVLGAFGIWKALIIPVFALLGLGFLFYISKKGRYYPAMPFVSIGCFLGYAVVVLSSV